MVVGDRLGILKGTFLTRPTFGLVLFGSIVSLVPGCGGSGSGVSGGSEAPDYFPDEFLCHVATFSSDDSLIYFIGEWWENE
jgi:hypothetical protein